MGALFHTQGALGLGLSEDPEHYEALAFANFQRHSWRCVPVCLLSASVLALHLKKNALQKKIPLLRIGNMKLFFFFIRVDMVQQYGGYIKADRFSDY